MTYTDGDLFSDDAPVSDCDDADANIYSGTDNDGDGYGACLDDCDDYDPSINEGV